MGGALKQRRRLLVGDLSGNIAGSVALTVAVLFPFCLVAGAGAVEMLTLSSDHSKMQDAADAAALAGASQLDLVPDSAVVQAAAATAQENLADVATRNSVSVSATVSPDRQSVQVAVRGDRQSFFGGLLTQAGYTAGARSAAAKLNRAARCIIGLSTTDGAVLDFQNTAQIAAPGCLIHSNQDISAQPGSGVNAGVVQAVGQASGPISPVPLTGAPRMADPFASRDLSIPSCPLVTGLLQLLDISFGSQTLQPGIHCQNVYVHQSGSLTLAPGDHYFLGDLVVGDQAHLSGSDVTLFFDKASHLTFQGAASISLAGRVSGTHAGLLMVSAPANTNDFALSSDNIQALEGVIYLPSARLVVSGTSPVGAQSKWTVTVSRAMQVVGSPTLVIKTDYANSSVPVPSGVGPGLGARLIH